MKLENKVLNYKLGLLKLAIELNNVSLACKIFGCSRPTYYRYKKAYLEGGEDALRDVSRKKPNPKNQVLPHIAEAVLSPCLWSIRSLASSVLSHQRRHTARQIPIILVILSHKILVISAVSKVLGLFICKPLRHLQ